MPHLKILPGWGFLKESDVTPETTYSSRRRFLAQLGIAGAGIAAALAAVPDPTIPEFWRRRWADLFPAARNETFKEILDLTQEELFTSYNNFYEFSLDKKRVKTLVGRFEASPWQVEIAGQVEKPGKYDLDDLIRFGPLEERIYHFRCVEAWSANVPWTGFPLSRLIEKVQPKSSARFLRFVTVYRPAEMPGQKAGSGYPWPYYEALTLQEASNELALLAFGLYGHPLNKQNGAPVRLILPWKFGFKSIKSITRIEFTEKQPSTFWDDTSREYGFWANINPRFDHPRWSQATEVFLNTGERIPTRLYNGYADYVAHLYKEDDRRYFY